MRRGLPLFRMAGEPIAISIGAMDFGWVFNAFLMGFGWVSNAFAMDVGRISMDPQWMFKGFGRDFN